MTIRIEIKKSESCKPLYILQNLGSIKQEANKLDFISDTLKRCAIAPAKTKRLMSGYNCFVKVQIKKTGKPLTEVVKAKTWSTLEPKQKATWKNLAKEGCPPRLWQTEAISPD